MENSRGSKFLRQLGLSPPLKMSGVARPSVRSARRVLFGDKKEVKKKNKNTLVLKELPESEIPPQHECPKEVVLAIPENGIQPQQDNPKEVVLATVHQDAVTIQTPEQPVAVLATQFEDHLEISPELSRIQWDSGSIDPPSPAPSNFSEEIDIEGLSDSEDVHELGRNTPDGVIEGCSRFLPLQEVRLKKKKKVEVQKDAVPKPIRQKSRKNCCPFCLKLITNFSRHLIKYHRDENEVKEYLKIQDANLKERKRKRVLITDALRKKGNHNYNLKVVNKEMEGELLPMRRPVYSQYEVSTRTHVACTHCLGLFKKENLYLHLKACPKKPTIPADEDSVQRKRVAKSAALMLIPESILKLATKSLRENVFKTMQGSLAFIAQNDPLIVEFGARYYNNHRDPNQVNYTSQRMRDLARVLEGMRKKCDGISCFQDCFHPKRFQTMMEVIRDLGEFDDETGYLGVPSIAPRLCSHLKTCADIVKSNLIKDSNQLTPEKNPKIKKIDHFIHLMSSDWNSEIGGNAEKTRKRNAAVKESILPEDEDIRVISQTITKKYNTSIQNLKNDPSVENYNNLNKLLIAHIIILSRRRPAEVCKATLDQYKKLAKNQSLSQRFRAVLSKEQKESESLLSIFHVIGKNGKTVPILLTKEMRDAADSIVEARTPLRINSKLLFARPDSTNIYNGTAILNEIKTQLQLKRPEHFTATGLRHHAATSTQLTERDDTYTENLATFMGHDVNIHKQNYRIPLPVIQKAQVGHRLLQMTLPATSTSEEQPSTSENISKPPSDNTLENLQRSPSYQSTCQLELEAQPLPDVHFLEDETSSSNDSSEPPSTKKRKVVTKRRWTEEEKEAIYHHFAQEITQNVAPERKRITKMLTNETRLRNRTVDQVVTYVSNIFTGKTKVPSPVMNRLKLIC